MGLRGPAPVGGKLRALRGGKAPAIVKPVPSEDYLVFRGRVRALEELAHKMLNKAKRRPTRKTKSNGIQVSAELNAALRLFDAADKVRGRLQRAGPKVVTSPKKSKWDGLL